MRAAIYVRMSTEEQANSPARQREQIEAYCVQQGYEIVARYEDLALRGNDDARPGFNALLRDAGSGRFNVVVVDEQSRLTRNDPLHFFAQVAFPLKRAGVVLDTVARGIQSWDDLAGMILQTIEQHGANREVVTLSRRVVTELTRKASLGIVYAGKPPFGYSMAWTDDAGEIVHTGRRNWSGRTPPGITPRLIPHEREAEIVRWIFDAYTRRDWSLKQIAEELAARGVRAVRGGVQWSRAHLRNLLTHRVYVGDYVFNRKSAGKFHRLSQGRAVAKTSDKTTLNHEHDWIVIPDHHPPLIDRETFARAGAMLKENRERRTPKPSRGDYILSHLLICSHCSGWMIGHRDRSGLKTYVCGGNARYGATHCRPYRVAESVVLGLILDRLRDVYLGPEHLAELRRVAREMQSKRDDAGEVSRAREVIQSLNSRIARATENILLLDTSLVPGAQDQLRGWIVERDRREAELTSLLESSPVEEIEEIIADLERRLWSLRTCMDAGEVQTIRAAVRENVSRVSLRWEEGRAGSQRRYRLMGGSLILSDGVAYELVRYGSPFCTSWELIG